MHQLAEGKVNQQNHDQEEMQAKEPVNLGDHGLKMNQAQGVSLHLHQVGPEKDPEKGSAEGDRQEEKQGKIISQDRDVQHFLIRQPAGEKKREGNGNQVAGVETQGLNALDPAGNRVEEITQMPEKDQPEQNMKGQPRRPEEAVSFEEAGKPEGIPDQSPDHSTPGPRSRSGDDPQGHRGPSPDPETVEDSDQEDCRTQIGEKDK